MIVLSLIARTVLSFYALWLLFVLVMHLKKVRDSKKRSVNLFGFDVEIGGLSIPSTVLGAPILLLGLVVDVFCNVVPLTLILVESPRWREWTVTARLKRHARGQDGWRKRFAIWVALNFTDDFDQHHILPKQNLNQPAK